VKILKAFFSKILETDRLNIPDQNPNPAKHFSSINQNFLQNVCLGLGWGGGGVGDWNIVKQSCLL
jgi:hypothetical protein